MKARWKVAFPSEYNTQYFTLDTLYNIFKYYVYSVLHCTFKERMRNERIFRPFRDPRILGEILAEMKVLMRH